MQGQAAVGNAQEKGRGPAAAASPCNDCKHQRTRRAGPSFLRMKAAAVAAARAWLSRSWSQNCSSGPALPFAVKPLQKLLHEGVPLLRQPLPSRCAHQAL